MEPFLGIVLAQIAQGITHFGRIDLGRLLAHGVEVTLRADEPLESAFVAGVVRAGRALSAQTSETFRLHPDVYAVDEARSDWFVLQASARDDRGSGIDRSVKVPNLTIQTPGLGRGRCGDPLHGMSVEPVIYDHKNPLGAFEGRNWDNVADAIDLDPESTALVLMLIPVDHDVRQRAAAAPAFLPILHAE